jgi:general secretion pathway protein I
VKQYPHAPAARSGARRRPECAPDSAPRGFTLLEVMIAMAVLGIALLALLSLHHQSLQTVIHGQDLTRAAMLAQAVMSQAELERFPNLGVTKGDFRTLFPNEYPNFRWERTVVASGMFPDVRKVVVTVLYGPNLSRSFSLTEYLHSPVPIELPNGQNPNQNPNQNPSQNPGQIPGILGQPP